MLPEHAQIRVPAAVFAVGVSVTVIAVPTELVTDEPATVINPSVPTVAAVTLPLVAIEQSAATVDGMVLKD